MVGKDRVDTEASCLCLASSRVPEAVAESLEVGDDVDAMEGAGLAQEEGPKLSKSSR